MSSTRWHADDMLADTIYNVERAEREIEGEEPV
jgi:hypothetical protein